MANVPAAGTLGGLSVPTVGRTRKRGLTVSAPAPADIKKPKVEPPPQSVPQDAKTCVEFKSTASMPKLEIDPSSTDAGEEFSEEEYDDSLHHKKIFHRLPGGPVTVLGFEDGITETLDGIPSFLVPKSAMLEVMSKTTGLSKNKAQDITDDILRSCGYWEAHVNEDEPGEELRRKEANLLFEKWYEVTRRAPSKQWWYEVIVQREKPTDGEPAVEFRWKFHLKWHIVAEEDKGSWWITGFGIPDEALNALALAVIADNAPKY